MRAYGVDQHFHTNCSDGANNPEEIMAIIRQQNTISPFYVCTDHDLINHWMYQLLQDEGIDTCYGIEISSFQALEGNEKRCVHLTYYTHQVKTGVEEILASIRSKKLEKIRQQINALIAYLKDTTASYENFIAFMQEKGHNSENANAFRIAEYIYTSGLLGKIGEIGMIDFMKRYLRACGDKYAEVGFEGISYEVPVETCTDMTTNNGGLLALPHSQFTFEHNPKALNSFVENFVERGGKGIEINAHASYKWVQYILELKQKYNLILTFGSDFHRERNGKHEELGMVNPCFTEYEVRAYLHEFRDYLEKNS